MNDGTTNGERERRNDRDGRDPLRSPEPSPRDAGAVRNQIIRLISYFLKNRTRLTTAPGSQVSFRAVDFNHPDVADFDESGTDR